MLKLPALAGALALAAALLAGCSATSTNTLANGHRDLQHRGRRQSARGLRSACDRRRFIPDDRRNGNISSAAVSAERAAMAGVNSICANPSAVNAATALQTLASAYVAIVEAGKTN